MHKNLTIVSIYGHNNGTAAIPSILRSMKELPGSQGLLLSPSKPDNLPSDIRWKKIGPLDFKMYSIFVMHSLYAFIATDYCLIVQEDGWVLNGKNWRDSYYDYDYIGGTSHAALVGNQMFIQYRWVDQKDPVLVLNGGFSLRSRRFLEVPNIHGIVHSPAEDLRLWNEDVQLSCLKKPLFESLGFKYAPTEVAKYFSMEHVARKFHDDMDFSRLFGHHAATRRLIGENDILVPHPIESIQNVYREPEFLNFLKQIGYNIHYAAPNPAQT